MPMEHIGQGPDLINATDVDMQQENSFFASLLLFLYVYLS